MVPIHFLFSDFTNFNAFNKSVMLSIRAVLCKRITVDVMGLNVFVDDAPSISVRERVLIEIQFQYWRPSARPVAMGLHAYISITPCMYVTEKCK